MIGVGTLVAEGRTSDVHEYGAGAVVKIPRPGVPAEWARIEAEITDAVGGLGLPAPGVLDVVEIDGREAAVFEHIHGDSMWQRMVERPADIEALTGELAEVHRQILEAGLPGKVESWFERMLGKLGAVSQLSESEQAEARRLLEALPSGAVLLHGDLHPANVLLGGNGIVVIDWFDASIGHPVADIVRSSILMRSTGDLGNAIHLRDATPESLSRLHGAYVRSMADALDAPMLLLRQWESLVGVSRLAEHAETNEASLLRLWAGRNGGARGPLLDALVATGRPEDDRVE